MDRKSSQDLGLERPNNTPICTSDFYGDAAGFWQPVACRNPSSMGMMRMFPFTTAQWQELQRQAMIYKHITASVPVPSHLLLPTAPRSLPEAPTIFLSPTAMVVGGGGGVSMKFANGSSDPEPGRCRRTDGKKWRCARDAAPDQKYCERHLHRGRPRSRKPVEQRRARCKSNVNVVASGSLTAKGKTPAASAAGGGVPHIELNLPFQTMEPNYHELSECPTSNRQWGTVEQHYEELPNLNYDDASDNWRSFLNPNLTSLESARVAGYNEPPRGFIDAWSSENMATTTPNNTEDPSLSCRDKLHLSTLTLSMSNAAEEEADASIKSQPLMNWMSSDSPLGGPLAEVLNQSSNLSSPGESPNTCSNVNSRADLINLMGNSCANREASPRDSPSKVLVSSPSGVLQKALVSLSDSSSSSSPTFAAAPSRSDFAFQSMNLNN